jgi:3-dehydroquinate synthase
MRRIQCDIEVKWPLQVVFSDRLFDPKNPSLRDVLVPSPGQPRARALMVLDASLAAAKPDCVRLIRSYFLAHSDRVELVSSPSILPGGEAVKNSTALVEEIHSQIERHHIDRQSYLIAVGGGALLDVAGFAAATAHRGVRHLRVPTTTLSQCDSGVGVKNGINAFGKKNFIGTFSPPWAVFIDCSFLDTLPPVHKRAGFAEAVKVACIRDAEFFRDLERDAPFLRAFDPEAIRRLVHRSAELHLQHITSGGDPFEMGSRRPLDFGHWVAHKLEQVSEFRLNHGQCVAIGVALDTLYSCRAGFLDEASGQRVLSLLEFLGFELFTEELMRLNEKGEHLILTGLSEFQEHLGGQLNITLPRQIGVGVEVHEMDRGLILQCTEALQGRSSAREPARSLT